MSVPRLKPTDPIVCYHVMIRTAQQVFWLQEPQIKEMLVDLIDFYSKVYYIKVLGYVIMSNHIHLCIENTHPEKDIDDLRRRCLLAATNLANPRPWRDERADYFYNRFTDLSQFMKEILSRFAVLYNKSKRTQGRFWSGPFKSKVLESGESLLHVLAYIELNPHRANMINDPADFPYSSVGRIKKELDQGKSPQAPQIEALGGIPVSQRAKAYLDWIRYVAMTKDHKGKNGLLPIKFTNQGLQVDMNGVYEALQTREPGNWRNRVYGSAAFIKKTLSKTKQARPEKPDSREGRSGLAA